ncbi:MAG: sulfatase-like hydrolase/transferase [Planctomycetota bacterium]
MKLALTICLCFASGVLAERPPNVILVMTDDQGWGEVGFHGNDVVKTPNLDRFAAEGTELTNFYVSPMCTPTRSSLMTGRYHFRTGAHDTYIGRSNMNPSETTIAEVFADAGYRTGIFGKWHLGENFPMRAQDQGFEKVVVHGGGGIGQFADFPGNAYWDPTLQYNDTLKRAEGYCTDVFINESIGFIRNSGDKPFFCYLPLNVPHSPFDVADEFRAEYDKQKLADPDGRTWVAPIYGMITQFDGAFARLLGALEEVDQRENTIVIFMSDNGPNSTYFTAGLRAKKGSVYENGIRSPFVIQWPKTLTGGRKLNTPAMHIDLFPTLADACGIDLPDDLKVDGKSILGLLKGESSAATEQLQQRTLFMQHNRGNLPTKYKNGMARRGPWKAVGNRGEPTGFELYNIKQDPGEKKNLAAEHPEMVESFVREYETWFDDVTAEMRRDGGMPYPFDLDPQQKLDFRFTWQDWWGENTGWRPSNYGRWRMSNRGLIDRFDVTIVPHRQHQGRAATVKFLWMDKAIVKEFQSVPAQVELSDIKLPKGTGFMEAQLHIGGKIHAVQEVRIRAHGAISSFPAALVSKRPAKSKPKTATTDPIALPEVRGQFVRIELPGKNRVLSLAEVSVYEKQRNVAQQKPATQSSIGFGGSAERAVDGNTDGNYHNHSVSHTESGGTNAWWEVDLGDMVNVEKIVVHNRTDAAESRLDGFTIKILDADRKVVFSQEQVAQAAVISFLRPGAKP